MVVWPQPHGSKGLIGRSRKFVAQYLGLASRFEPYGVELLQVDQYLPSSSEKYTKLSAAV